jgi:maleate isomerase
VWITAALADGQAAKDTVAMELPAFSGPPGKSGRIGVIQPSPGLMLEAEWARAMPEGVAFPVTRLVLHGATRADYAAMAMRAPDAAAILANARVDIIAYACGIGSLAEGPGAERTLMRTLQDAAGGIRVVGMAEAAMTALRAHHARRVTLLTPYAAEINALVEAYLVACGFEVAAIAGLPTTSPIAAAGLQPQQIVQAAGEAARLAPTDAIWIPCSNVRTIDTIPAIERAIGMPCVSSNKAMLDSALGHLGIRL